MVEILYVVNKYIQQGELKWEHHINSENKQ